MPGPPSRATVVAAALVLALALASAATAWTQSGPKRAGEGELNVSAGGALRIDDSRGEGAILRAPALAPGAATVGKVTIRNRGKAGYLVLSRRRLVATPGAGGASLADALRLTIHDLGQGAHAVVYSGKLAKMPPLRLGLLPPAAERRFRFIARLPEPALVDNAPMGSRVRLDYRWQLTPNRP